MGEDSANARNRRTQAHEERARALAEENAERIGALPPKFRPGPTAPTVLKVETLIALWCGDSPELQAQFGAEYQGQLSLALDDLEARAAEAQHAEAAARLIRPAGTGGIVTPPRTVPPRPG